MRGAPAGGGEIVQVEGGHILRATGRKDRHSKVYTAKGPRDRRVRLSAHTAIQFYDVQDRLGYDRPSKAVDWLMKKAKDAIDKLDEVPQNDDAIDPATEFHPSSSEAAPENQSESSSRYALQPHKLENPSGNSFPFMPTQPEPSLVNLMKSFYPTTSGPNCLMNFQEFPHDIVPRTSYQVQDLGLSLHTLHDHNSNLRPSNDEQVLSGSNITSFQASYQAMNSWNDSANAESRVGFLMNAQAMHQQAFLSEDLQVSQRELLQSNFPPLIQQNLLPRIHQASDSSSHFALGFRFPARFHGDEDPGAHDD